jgi:phage-related minor tail protein
MTDIATLGIAIDAGDTKNATTALDGLDASAKRVDATTTALTGKFKVTNGQMADTKRLTDAANQANRDAVAVTTQLTIGQQLFIEKLQAQAAAAGLSKTKLLELQAAEMGLTEVSKGLIAQIEAATEAQGKHSFSMGSSLAKMEAMRVGHDALIGSYSRMGSSAFVLANATGLTTLAFSAAGLAVIGLLAPIGLLAYEMIKGAIEQDKFNKAMVLTGGYAGQTEDSIKSLAGVIGTEITGGTRKATDMLLGLAESGRFTSAELSAVGAAALDFAHLSGESADKVIKHFEGMIGKTAEWAAKQNEQYHFLNAIQYEHILALEKQGYAQEAVIYTANLMHESMKTSATSLPPILDGPTS